MNVIACGTGYNTVSLEEACLERGVNIVAYIEPELRAAETIQTTRREEHVSPVYGLLRMVYSLLGARGRRIALRLAEYAGFYRPKLEIPDGYLFAERVEGKRIILPSQVGEFNFDYVVIGHPCYEPYRWDLLRQGVSRRKILSLWDDERLCLDKLGTEKFFLARKKKIVGGKPKRSYEALPLQGLATEDVPSPVPIKDQYPLVRKLIESCKAALEAIPQAPAPYRPGSNWAWYLSHTRGNLLELIQENRVEELTELLNSCLRNRLTEGIYGGLSAYNDWCITPYAEQIERMKACYNAWSCTINQEANIRELAMPPIGNPYGLRVDGVIINANCFYNHYRALLGSRLLGGLERPVAAEIGGGVGLFCYFLMKSMKRPVYIDFDLPENLLVESYFLSMAFPEKRILCYEGRDQAITGETLAEYDIILMPNFMLPALADQSVDLFVNTISLSEMDYDTIAEYLKQIERTCRKYFYHENLADFNFSYKSYPVDLFPIPETFREIMTAASRWPHFSLTSRDHFYVESLYEKR